MKKLFVYADFDWMETPQLIGELSCDSVRGSETYGFSYDRKWLAKYGDFFSVRICRTIPASNTPDRNAIYLRVSPMLSPTAGAAHC